MDENLLLVREPRNPYDRNAIRVDNVLNHQVGQYFPSKTTLTNSIPRDVAAVLAPLMDSGVLKAEGTVMGQTTVYNIPISIQLLARQASAQGTLSQLMNHFVIRDRPGRAGQALPKQIRSLPPPPQPPHRAPTSSSESTWRVFL